MSRNNHSFVRLPLEPADPWFRLRYAERALGADMFRVFGNEERLDVAIADVADVVCRRLAVDGRDRPAVRRSIERLIEAGLLVQDGQVTRLLYSRESHREWSANVRSSSSQRTANVQQTSGERTANVRSSSSETKLSLSNDSNDVSQIDREIDREIERKSACAGRSPLSPPGSAHEFEVKQAWQTAWADAKAGRAPALTSGLREAAIEFARGVAQDHGKTLYEAAYDIARHVLKHSKGGKEIPFDLARMDPYAAAQKSPNAPAMPRILVWPAGLP